MGKVLMDIATEINEELFDETAGYDDETGVRFASGLTPEERHQATILYRLFQELWGVCLVVGDPGTGKDVFGNYISYQIKRFFPWKRILRDEKPRKLYGEYAGLFNEAVLSEDLARMRDIAKGVSIKRIDEAMEKAADVWVAERGQVMLKNSVLFLTEYWRYCYNREPHNPMNKTMGGIQKQKRHLDVLILGTAQLETELDKKTSLPWVDWKVTATRSVRNKTGFAYYIQKVKYERRLDLLVPISDSFPIRIDAGKPRTDLGDGKIVIKKPNYIPETEEERIVLTVLKEGVDTYEGIVEYLDNYGDMEEWEVLETLKELKFRRSKRVLEFPCWFGIFNSKSAPNLRTSLKVVED